MTRDRYRLATAAAVLVVAAIADIVSYQHIAPASPGLRAAALAARLRDQLTIRGANGSAGGV